MFHRIEAVRALADFVIEVRFLGGVVKSYDTKTLVDCIPQFVELQTKNGLFEQVRVDQGGYGVFWNDDLDIDSDTIWEDGTLIEKQNNNINDFEEQIEPYINYR